MNFAEPVVEFIQLLWVPLARRVGYLKNLRANIGKLGDEVEELSLLAADLQTEMSRATLEGNIPTDVAKGWHGRAEKIIADAARLVEEFEENKKCFNGWCVDRPSRYKLGKRVVSATQLVVDLKGRRNFDRVAVPPLPENTGSLATTSITGQSSAAAGTQEKIWEWLQDPQIGKIGVWGMGGIGKTTIMRNIYNKLQLTQQFDVLAFVTVSKDLNMRKLRNDIRKELSINLPEEESEDRASKLLHRELQKKKFLLILDDMWEKVDLDELGIPAPDEPNGCKVALTTRSRSICNDMETDREVMVEVLPEEEAWELFRARAGGAIIDDSPPAIRAIARDVCRECHGLPLAIIVVGRAMRKEADVRVWDFALTALKSSQFELKGMKREVYLPLKFSFDRLESDTLRKCFLYCSLFPEDYEIDIDQLIEYWSMEGLIDGVESLKAASSKGHYLLKELIDSCMLEKHRSWKETVKMHDVIRDMAIKITSESREGGCRFFVRAGVGLHEWVDEISWEELDKVSVMENNIQKLADEPRCMKLSTLLLQGNDLLEAIPQAFFEHMRALRVLDLSSTKIESFPHSISKLITLHALILRDCFSLKSLNHVGGLGELRLLDLRSTRIQELPEEVAGLTRLLRLNLSRTRKLEFVAPGVISRLSQLQDLEMEQSCYFRKSEGKELLIQELGFLKHLNHLSLDVTDHICAKYLLGNFHNWKRMSSFYFRFGTGDPRDDTSYIKYKKRVSLPERRGKCLDLTQTGYTGLLNYAEKLCLYNQHSVTSISELGTQNLNFLKECWVWECQRIETVVVSGEAEENTFPCLQVLVLSHLPNLRSVWEGSGVPGSFRNIKRIDLNHCPRAVHLFSSSLVSQFHTLEEIKVSDCYGMEEVVAGGVGEVSSTLPRLGCVVLENMFSLREIWKCFLSLPALQEIKVIYCPNLKKLPLIKDNAPKLQAIMGGEEWWEKLEWENRSSKSHFQSFFRSLSHHTQSSSSLCV